MKSVKVIPIIKRRFSHHKTAFYTSENGVLQSENGVFLTIKCKGFDLSPLTFDFSLFAQEGLKCLDTVFVVCHASRLAAAVHGQDGIAHVDTTKRYR